MNTVTSTHPPINITSKELEEHFEFIVDLCHRENITFMFEHNNKTMCLVPYEEYLDYGVQRSLVAHPLWERGVAGSNPVTPIWDGGGIGRHTRLKIC